MVNESLQFYVDTMVIETMFTDPRIIKDAQSGVVSSLLSNVFSYFQGKISEVKDSDHKLEMITNFLLPGILAGFGFPILGGILKISQVLFHFDITKIVKEISSSVKNLVSGNKQTTSEAIDNLVSSTITSNLPPDPNEDELKSILDKKAKFNLREAQLFKFALQNYLDKNPDVDFANPDINIKFAAGWFSSSLATFLSSRGKTTKILISLFSWIVKTALAAGGFMILGDVINKIVGNNTSSIDGQPKNNSTETTNYTSTTSAQNVLKPSSNYAEEFNNGPNTRWILQGDLNSIDSTLIAWAEEIYPDLKNHEDIIRAARTFNLVIQAIKSYNTGSPMGMIFIPRQWKSRKQIVDQFIDEVVLHGNFTSKNSITTPNYLPIPNPSLDKTI